MAWFHLCFFILLSQALAQSSDSLISCYGFGNWEYGNNTACPGSNACCGSEATCISNRLCHNPEDGAETFVRAPCQDINFGFESCPQICRNAEENGGVLPRVTRCRNGSFCCASDTGCCGDGRGKFLNADGLVLQSSPKSSIVYTSWGPERTEANFRTDALSATNTDVSSASDATATASSISSSTVSTVSSSVPTSTSAESDEDSDSDDKNSGSNNTGLRIGLGVGISVGVLAIISGVAFLLWRRKKRSRLHKDDPAGSGSTQSETHDHKPGPHYSSSARAGSPGVVKPWRYEGPAEMDGGYINSNGPQELDGTGRQI